MALFGGFAGGEASLDERDVNASPTVLSGDIGGPGDLADNTHCIVVADSADRYAVLDGFVIAGARADGPEPYDRGGGIRNIGGTLTLANCRLVDNRAYTGGGLLNLSGAINNTGSSLVLSNATVVDNAATGQTAGGVLNNNGATITVTNCILWGNTSACGIGFIRQTLRHGSIATNICFKNP